MLSSLSCQQSNCQVANGLVYIRTLYPISRFWDFRPVPAAARPGCHIFRCPADTRRFVLKCRQLWANLNSFCALLLRIEVDFAGEVRRAFRARARLWHPDRGGDPERRWLETVLSNKSTRQVSISSRSK